MKLAYEHFSTLLETSGEKIVGLVIEEPMTLYRFMQDFREAMEGKVTGIVLSENDKILDIPKCAEFVTDFIRFEINSKNLLAKLIASIEKISENEIFFDSSRRLLAEVENYIMEITLDMPCSLSCEKLTMQGLLKGIGISVADDYSCLEERLLVYMDLMREFLGKKLFVLVNARGFIAHENLQQLINMALLREHEIILVDNREYSKLHQEERIIIDEDLCEF